MRVGLWHIRCRTSACSETALQLRGSARVAELGRVLLHGVQLAFAETLVIRCRSAVMGGPPRREHVRDRTTKERHMSDPQPGTERPYQVDDAWSRAVFARCTGARAAFFLLHLRPGMRLIDCGCGPGSVTVDLAQAVTPGKAISIRQTRCWRRGTSSAGLSASTASPPCPACSRHE
jgi:hypothetical protein